jgi:hypothetical protein
MPAKIIEFPKVPMTADPSCDGEGEVRPAVLKPCMELDRQLDRALRNLDENDPIRKDLFCGTNSIASSNVFRMLRNKPAELLVFCNTISGENEDEVAWGDVYCLTDDDTYRFIFTMYTADYVGECRHLRGEVIEASEENIILPASGLTLEHLVQGVEKWVNEYYPGLAGVPVRLEDPEAVREMIRDSLVEDPP